MDEHRWKFKVGSNRYDQYRAIRGQNFPYARVEVLSGGAWDIFVGQPVAEEMLHLATENEELAWAAATAEAQRDRLLDERGGDRQKIRDLKARAEEQRTRIALLEASEVRIMNDAIETTHDLSVKLELAEARVAELEERCARSIEEWQAID